MLFAMNVVFDKSCNNYAQWNYRALAAHYCGILLQVCRGLLDFPDIQEKGPAVTIIYCRM